MIKFRAKSNIVLGVLAFISLLAFLAVENNKVDVKQDWYKEKLEAAELSQFAAQHLKKHRLGEGIFIDDINDPNQTALIGQEYSLITTSNGNFDSKLSSTNPNFAAIVIQLFKDAGLEKGDNVAIAMSGSFPALNISVISAIETLDLNPILISSVGSSNFGANDPFFTWLDMEKILFDANIFHSKSVAASIGGGSDLGRGLSPKGRELLKNAIYRNNIKIINKEHLSESISERMKIYNEASNGKSIKVFINVGGGIASLGSSINGKIIPSGLTRLLPDGNFPVHGVIIKMGHSNIPIINMLNIDQLLIKFGLPSSPIPLPEPGDGEIFVQKKYSFIVTSIATFILLIIIILVYISERKHHRLGIDPVPMPNLGSEQNKVENALDL